MIDWAESENSIYRLQEFTVLGRKEMSKWTTIDPCSHLNTVIFKRSLGRRERGPYSGLRRQDGLHRCGTLLLENWRVKRGAGEVVNGVIPGWGKEGKALELWEWLVQEVWYRCVRTKWENGKKWDRRLSKYEALVDGNLEEFLLEREARPTLEENWWYEKWFRLNETGVGRQF